MPPLYPTLHSFHTGVCAAANDPIPSISMQVHKQAMASPNLPASTKCRSKFNVNDHSQPNEQVAHLSTSAILPPTIIQTTVHQPLLQVFCIGTGVGDVSGQGAVALLHDDAWGVKADGDDAHQSLAQLQVPRSHHIYTGISMSLSHSQ